MHFGLIFICGVAVLLIAERAGCPASESGVFVDVVTSEQKHLYPHHLWHMDSQRGITVFIFNTSLRPSCRLFFLFLIIGFRAR